LQAAAIPLEWRFLARFVARLGILGLAQAPPALLGLEEEDSGPARDPFSFVTKTGELREKIPND
jgi:hypothetical protein